MQQLIEVLDTRTILLFIIWLVGCVAATSLNVWEVGNAAHISGLLFGSAVAGAFVLPFKPRLIRCGLVALVMGSIIPLFWCPWSTTWLSIKAYDAHAARQYDVALARYTQIIQRNPKDGWAYSNRSHVYQELKQPEKALIDLRRAREIDPSIDLKK